jgi:large subunit ribosomal protein L3
VFTKVGMSALYLPTGERLPCTILQLDRCQIVGLKTRERHGYDAVQVGAGWRKPENVSRANRGDAEKKGVPLKAVIREFRCDGFEKQPEVQIGAVLGADWFIEGQFVDARANGKGKGFAGVSSPLLTLYEAHSH